MSSPHSATSPPSSPRSSPSTFSDESSIELSFDYELDDEGRLIRVSKSSSKEHKSPPLTPPQTSEPSSSRAANASTRRSSLSRSESMPGASSMTPAARPLSRTSSGPVSMQAHGYPLRSLGTAPSSGGSNGSGRKPGGAQRIRRDEAERQRREIEERIRRGQEEAELEKERERLRREQEEKEKELKVSLPQAQRPIATLPSRSNAAGLSRATRSVAFAKAAPSVRTFDEHGVNGRGEISDYAQQRRTGIETRGDPYSHLPTSRSASSYNASVTKRPVNASGPRRVTHEERMRQEQEIAEEEALAKATENQLKRSPSPPYAPMQNGSSHSRSRQGRSRRRDSDTLRSGVPFPQRPDQSEEEFDRHPRLSPSSRTLGGTTAVQPNSRTRDSPPSSDRPKSVAGDYSELEERFNGKARAPSNGRRARQQRWQQPYEQQLLHQLKLQRNTEVELPFILNGTKYYKLEEIGKGGSSHVFKVMDTNNQIFALKSIALDKADEEMMEGYHNEIILLNRLAGNPHVIRVVEWKLDQGKGSRGTLLVLMECGEVDLARLLNDRRKEPLNMLWVAYYWQQILKAVNVVHEERVVHTDLKPANFVLVKGQLKIIDFGIARAIANDTTNIMRENQVGTVNYMSPESIEVPQGMRRLKIGRPSDIWSLGVILYQMVYGHTPFQFLNFLQKMKAIPDDQHVIEFPEVALPGYYKKDMTTPPEGLQHLMRPVRKDVIKTMKACLARDAKDRPTIPELLADDWLTMREPIPPSPPAPKPVLDPGEAIINLKLMKRLVKYTFHEVKANEYETKEKRSAAAEFLLHELKRVNAYGLGSGGSDGETSETDDDDDDDDGDDDDAAAA